MYLLRALEAIVSLELVNLGVSIIQQNDMPFQRYLGPLLGPLFIYMAVDF